MFEKILVCLDGSELAEQVLPLATEVAIRFNSQIILFQALSEPSLVTSMVLPPPSSEKTSPSEEIYGSKVRDENALVVNYLESLAKPLREKGLNVECATAIGDAGKSIVNYAYENDINLIAIATHGRSGLKRMVFGGVADYVMRQSKRPLLVINPE